LEETGKKSVKNMGKCIVESVALLLQQLEHSPLNKGRSIQLSEQKTAFSAPSMIPSQAKVVMPLRIKITANL
jgi:hypothetical protein